MKRLILLMILTGGIFLSANAQQENKFRIDGTAALKISKTIQTNWLAVSLDFTVRCNLKLTLIDFPKSDIRLRVKVSEVPVNNELSYRMNISFNYGGSRIKDYHQLT